MLQLSPHKGTENCSLLYFFICLRIIHRAMAMLDMYCICLYFLWVAVCPGPTGDTTDVCEALKKAFQSACSLSLYSSGHHTSLMHTKHLVNCIYCCIFILFNRHLLLNLRNWCGFQFMSLPLYVPSGPDNCQWPFQESQLEGRETWWQLLK